MASRDVKNYVDVAPASATPPWIAAGTISTSLSRRENARTGGLGLQGLGDQRQAIHADRL